MERTREDYAEIMAALERFRGQRIWITYTFRNGSETQGVVMPSQNSPVFFEVCNHDLLREPAAVDWLAFSLARPVINLCRHSEVQVWESGFRVTSSAYYVATATLLDTPLEGA